jgi:PAS domain S-box-containing protein
MSLQARSIRGAETDSERTVQASTTAAGPLRSGDPLFTFDAALMIVSWNRAAEVLTGVSREEAVGRRCWEVLGGRNERGDIVCHPGCAIARLAREGWPVRCQTVLVNAAHGKRRVDVSTVEVDDADRRLFAHVMVPRREPAFQRAACVRLTPRQLQVLDLLADGVPAKVIAARLALAEATVRNHIRAILIALATHSQLEAIAEARRLQLIA